MNSVFGKSGQTKKKTVDGITAEYVPYLMNFCHPGVPPEGSSVQESAIVKLQPDYQNIIVELQFKHREFSNTAEQNFFQSSGSCR